MARSVKEEELKDHLVDRYRELVSQRYTYDLIKKDLPEGVDEEIVNALRHYFLTYLYPPAEQRKELDEAFSHLANYVNQPAKVWGLLGNLAGAIFRFGTLLIDALKAGLVSLDTHVAAQKFEDNMYKAALKEGFEVPLTDEEFKVCITDIDRRSIERFIDDIGKLFSSMSNSKLLKKTLEIMGDVVKNMERKSRVYTKEEVEGIKLGISILQEGYDLFLPFPEELKKTIVAFIVEKERAFTAELYAEKEA